VRHTKIIATLGPASNTPEIIEALIHAGANVFRLNFSHGTHETHSATVDAIRAVSGRIGVDVAILQDLSGPKIRTGRIEGGGSLDLAAGDTLEIRIGNDEGRRGMVSTSYAPLAAAVKRGDTLLLDDGKIVLAVENATPQVISTRVVDGGALGQHKGINAPNVPLPAVGVTSKDEADLRFGLRIGIDLIGLSFVQTAEDVARARRIAMDAGHPMIPIIAKLERPEAIERLPAICQAADALMVARGDLGLELPLEQVPQVQKKVLLAGRNAGIPVIVATQVLESMRTESRPTRAEVSDAAGAVDAGADAIMLSGETAAGLYPVRAVEILDAIIRDAEALPPPWSLPTPSSERPDHLPSLCDAAVTLAARAGVDAIAAITRHGRTARLLAARRPQAAIYAITASEAVARQLNLWWGVRPVFDPLTGDMEEVGARVLASLRTNGGLPSPALVVMVNSSPDIDRPGANFVRLRRI
jgi:pyruvate kinase